MKARPLIGTFEWRGHAQYEFTSATWRTRFVRSQFFKNLLISLMESIYNCFFNEKRPLKLI